MAEISAIIPVAHLYTRGPAGVNQIVRRSVERARK
jgi:hypothetical protein